jgi:hypothetical protein
MRTASVLLAGLLLFVASPSYAVSRFASLALWEEQAGEFLVEDFEATPLGKLSCPTQGVFICPDEIVVEASLLNIIIPTGSDFDNAMGVFEPGLINGTREYSADLHSGVLVEGIAHNTIVFPEPVVAFAVDLARVEDYDIFGGHGPVPFPLTFDVVGESFEVAFGATFFGVTSDVPFASIVFRSTDTNQGDAVFPSLDNIRFQAIPEPGSGLLVAAGLVVLANSGNRARSRRITNP